MLGERFQFQREQGNGSSYRWRCRCYLYLHILQHDRLQRATASSRDQRLEMIGGSTASHPKIGLDCRSAKMAVEDCPAPLLHELQGFLDYPELGSGPIGGVLFRHDQRGGRKASKRIHQMTIAQRETAFPDDACKACLTKHRWLMIVPSPRCGAERPYDRC